MISTIKHAHHTFDVDQDGKDSYRHRTAGAQEVLLTSRTRWALMHENRVDAEATLEELLSKLAPVDLVLVEGFKRDSHAKIECHRAETGNGLLAGEDETVVAVASNASPEVEQPVFDLNDTTNIADFVVSFTGLSK